jgi:mRNA deadenylase 3'-5' endonuclease subunit Ccr4
MHFSFVTYNILADIYIRSEWYPNTPAKWLDPAVRHGALLAELILLNADVFALQEIEHDLFVQIETGLNPLGYSGFYAPKGRDKPDGCATFVRSAKLELIEHVRHPYDDGTGHIALVSLLRFNGKTLGVANTHLKWAPPETPPEEHVGVQQACALAAICAAHACDAWIVCGDLNCTPNSALFASLQAAAFEDAHGGALTPTCNANREARKLDHVLHTRQLAATPSPIAQIDAQTPLPSADHPSDHLPVQVVFGWR